MFWECVCQIPSQGLQKHALLSKSHFQPRKKDICFVFTFYAWLEAFHGFVQALTEVDCRSLLFASFVRFTLCSALARTWLVKGRLFGGY